MVKCNGLSSRKGLFEAVANIHAGGINIETWNINPNAVISHTLSVRHAGISGNDVESFITQLQEAVTDFVILKINSFTPRLGISAPASS